jgi:Transposase zinc-binding domain
MDRPKWEVADVFRHYGEAYRDKHGASMSTAPRRVMTAVELCRTAALGGHLEQCDQCGHERNAYNSCANRHCPKCQSLARAEWLEDRRSELLHTQYFHVVFTVPEQIAAIAYQNKRAVYGILFRATAETLRTSAADPQHLGAFSPCSTPGGRTCFIIPTCIVWFPALGCLRTAPGGSPAVRDSSCRSVCSPGCFAGCSWRS